MHNESEKAFRERVEKCVVTHTRECHVIETTFQISTYLADESESDFLETGHIQDTRCRRLAAAARRRRPRRLHISTLQDIPHVPAHNGNASRDHNSPSLTTSLLFQDFPPHELPRPEMQSPDPARHYVRLSDELAALLGRRQSPPVPRNWIERVEVTR